MRLALPFSLVLQVLLRTVHTQRAELVKTTARRVRASVVFRTAAALAALRRAPARQRTPPPPVHCTARLTRTAARRR